jgi:hypothetical protein
MSGNLPSTVDEWFESVSEESEFVQIERSFPYSVIGPISIDAPIVFTTKPACVLSSICVHPECGSIALIGRPGLPSRNDLNWLRSFVGKHRLFFLGDMDPVDLMVFTWLRENLKPMSVEHFGVSDSFIEALKVQLPDSFIMSCAPSEISSLSCLAAVFPDFGSVVGDGCAKLLDEGRKIELEAVVSMLAGTKPILPPDILLAGEK